MNIFERMFYSMFKLRRYGELIQTSMLKVVLYGIFMWSLTIAVISGVTYTLFVAEYGTIERAVEAGIPDFHLKDGVLTMDKPIFLNEGRNYVNVDTSHAGAFLKDGLDAQKIKEMSKVYDRMIIADQERIVTADNGRITEMYYRDVFSGEYVKKDFYNFISPLFIPILVTSFLFSVVFYFMLLLLFSFIETGFSRVFGLQPTFSTVFKVAVHASTPVCFFLLLSFFFGFDSFAVNWFAVILIFMATHMALMYMQRQEQVIQARKREETEAEARWQEESYAGENVLHQSDVKDPLEAWGQNMPDSSQKELEDRKEGDLPFSRNTEDGAANAFRQGEMSQQDSKSHYVRHQPEVLTPSSGWSFGEDDRN